MNQLLYGDCLELMKDLPDESVDLIYLDPPFKSDTDYNMLFGSEQGEDMAQARAAFQVSAPSGKGAQQSPQFNISVGKSPDSRE